MAAKTVKVTARKLNRRDDLISKLSRVALFLIVILAFLYLFLMSANNGGRFFISLDPNYSLESGLFLYEDKENKSSKSILYVEDIEFMDNISINWLPEDIHEHEGGSHNGENYLAHTFYIENMGNREVNYWYEIYIDNVIKNVDEAIRFMVIVNDETSVYAKASKVNGEAEPGTLKFYDEEIPVVKQRPAMKPGDSDKITVVIFIEGNDPECLDDLVGGEIKAHMRITEGHIEQEGE